MLFSLGCAGALITAAAGAGGNLLQYSEELDRWERRSDIAVSANVAPAPDGALTADRVTDNSSRTHHWIYSNAVVADGGSYVFSCWLKAGTLTRAMLSIYDVEGGRNIGSATVSLSTTWQRLSVRASSTVAGRRLRAQLYPSSTAKEKGSILAWGGQLEQGTTPGSYQKTPAEESDTTPPAAPQGLAGTCAGTAVQLAWQAGSEPDLAGYRVERSTGTTAPVTFPASGASYLDSQVSPGTEYSYQVRAVDAAGNVSSVSSAVTVTVTVPLPAPTGLAAVWDGTAVALTWSTSSDARVTGYVVERGANSSTAFSRLASTATATYKDGAALGGNTYYYRVRAVDAAGTSSGPSSVVSAAVPLTNPVPVTGANYYVAPNGTSTGDGSLARPWNLVTALKHPSAVKPGDTIWLRGGRYGTGGATTFYSGLTGTVDQPIVVRQYLGERATVDGRINSHGDWTWFWGFEITNSSLVRTTTQAGRPGGLDLYGRGNKAINLIIHDAGHPGIGFWQDVGDGGEIYGCLLWGNGIYDNTDPLSPTTRGSAIYAKNQLGTRKIQDVIAFRNFTFGMKLYCGSSEYVNGFHVEGNVAFNNPDGNLSASTTYNPIERLKVIGNHTYQRRTDTTKSVSLGYEYGYNVQHRDVEIRDNYFVAGTHGYGALFASGWQSASVTGNTVIGPKLLANWTAALTPLSQLWNGNRYHGNAGVSLPFRRGSTGYGFSGWKTATGFDANSSYVTAYPTGTHVSVRPNRYEAGRGHLVVYNWDLAPTVEVDVSSVGLQLGDSYEVVDAQNYYGAPVASGTYDGLPVRLPLTLTETAPLTGTVTHLGSTHTAPEFGVFVIRRLR